MLSKHGGASMTGMSGHGTDDPSPAYAGSASTGAAATGAPLAAARPRDTGALAPL
jgi:hypothetical protein